jgi:hypothetical protein
MGMKTILVPTENHDAMRSTLETALQLARRCDAYIEGFALRWDISKFVAIDGVPMGIYGQDIPEEAKQACQIFESFMREHDVPRATRTTVALSFGWLVWLTSSRSEIERKSSRTPIGTKFRRCMH